MKKIDKNSPIPKYYQLREILREMIENEELKPGEIISGEMELCKFHGISRMTVRKAIQDLVNEGMLYREQGKGTFVSYPKQKKNISQLLSFTEEMKSKGYNVTNRLLYFNKEIPEKKISKIFHMKKGEMIYVIKRIRFAGKEPIALEISYLPEKNFPNLSREESEKNSLYYLFENKYGIKLKYGTQTVEPVILTPYEADLFNVNENMLGLLFKRTTYSDDDTIVEYTKSIYRCDIYKYEAILKRKL
ncbi:MULTISPECIES: GntR family transcriptional regulator [Tissierellales]|jgi:GntR family transcriptional regulator|uniref:GntR family transcriptional regulator n=1 Tax=Acidilutibacter cellobiosedens TaxID=2507161 RepID=A0A410QFM4_9FIRM|nr:MULTISPECIES: GntR family transcriptional regulator [Tissierellales]MBE6083102.1 GntR family transcriptional regulator [Tissierellaceae bacterium]QAT62810.1 GntR family transcriptional regulator [Acidilutibacter cellobiosedens]SCL93243.1 HTH-type transcriptional repressor YvoA [Sporanaerobacter sp. PP17-6a]